MMDNGSNCEASVDAAVRFQESQSDRHLNPLAVSAAIKRAIDVMDSAISTKPAKLARYDNGIKDDQFQPLGDFYREIQTDRTEISTSLRNFRVVIPPDMLKLDERHTPLDVEAFLSRVETYDLLLWPNKPERISAFHCSRYGWRIAGSNTLVCVSCHRVEVIPQDPPSCMTLREWTSKIEHRIQKTGHMSGCIWTKSPSPLNILQLPDGRDMQHYMSRASESFKQMKILPVFTDHYRQVMAQADLSGLKSKSNMNLTQRISGADNVVIEDTALFLMMNGWTMEGAFENTIKCQLCLRQTPLWLCSSASSKFLIPDIESSSWPCSPRTKAESNIKEFDPILNHLSWCPWRRKLQSVDREEKMDDFLTDDETNMFASEGLTVDPRKQPNIDDYLKMAAKIDDDYKSGRLLYGSALQMSNYNKAIETIVNVKELLDSAVRSSKHPVGSGRRPDFKATGSTNNDTNDIMSIRLNQNAARKLLDSDSDSACGSLLSITRLSEQNVSGENVADLKSESEILLHEDKKECSIASVPQPGALGEASESEPAEFENRSQTGLNETTVHSKSDERDTDVDVKADQSIDESNQPAIPIESNAHTTAQPNKISPQSSSPTVGNNDTTVQDTLISSPTFTQPHIERVTEMNKEMPESDMDQDNCGRDSGTNINSDQNCTGKENLADCDSSAQESVTQTSLHEVESDCQQEDKQASDGKGSNANESSGYDCDETLDSTVTSMEIDKSALPVAIEPIACRFVQLDEVSSVGDNNFKNIDNDTVVETQEGVQQYPSGTSQDSVFIKEEIDNGSLIENPTDAKPQEASDSEKTTKDGETESTHAPLTEIDTIVKDVVCTEGEIGNPETPDASSTENQADPVEAEDEVFVEKPDVHRSAVESNTAKPDSQSDKMLDSEFKTVEKPSREDETPSKTEPETTDDTVTSQKITYTAEVSGDEEKGDISQSEDEKEGDNDASNEEEDEEDNEPDAEEESEDEDFRRREEKQEDFQEEVQAVFQKKEQEDFELEEQEDVQEEEQEDFQEEEQEDLQEEEEYEENESEEEEWDDEEEEGASEGEVDEPPQVQNGNVGFNKSGNQSDSSDSDVIWLD